MENNNQIDKQTQKMIREFSYDMASLKRSLKFLYNYIEGLESEKDERGMASLIGILQAFVQKMNNNYNKIQDKLKIER